MTESDEVLDAAWRAWNGFTSGCSTGDWDAFIAVLDPDVRFCNPLPGFHGENKGLERVRAYARYVSADFKVELVFADPFRVTRDGNTVVFEAENEGTVAGNKVQNRLAMFFEVRNGAIATFSEYLGVLAPPST